MDTTQLTRVLTQDTYIQPHFVAVCSHDALESHITHTFKKKTRQTAALVFNLDPHPLPGSHWVAVYLDFNGHAEYFDSTGLPPDPACCELLARVCPRSPIKYNSLKMQDDTLVCGQFCVVFFKLRCRGYSYNDCLRQLHFKNNDRVVYEIVKEWVPNLPFHSK